MSVAKIFLLILILSLSSQHALAVNIGLFGDIRLKATDIKDDPYGFELGDLDFYATQELSDNTRGFVELVFENTSSGIVTDLERLWIMHTFNDEFKLSAGRFHTPLGRWNRTYHHGALVQDTVSRPFFLDFEDGATGVLPVHVVGVMSTGDIIRKNDEFNYEIAIGNGPSIDSSGGFSPVSKPEIDINVSSDTNKNKTLAARVIYGHDDIPVKIGLFAMTHEISESAATGGLTNFRSTLIDQTIFGTDLLFTQNKIEVLAEYYQFRNKSNIGTIGSYSASAWYVQFNYEIFNNFKFIAREESLSFDKNNDSYFLILGTEQAKHHVLALRYDIDESNAIKFELNAADNDFSTDTTTFTVQWAFLIP
ncbi:MAG: hypothetical protein ACC657_10815 [Thiohalomonadales bacterium]